MKIFVTSRPRIAEYLISAFAVVSLWGSAVSFWNGEYAWSHNPNYIDPFATYNANPGIRVINAAASMIDVVTIGTVLAWTFRFRHLRAPVKLLLIFTVFGAALTWIELWYGSTFDYGPVRDKQGLPFGVNHGGVLGRFLFLTYVIWRIDWSAESGIKSTVIRVLLTVLLVVVQTLILRLVEELWYLLQS